MINAALFRKEFTQLAPLALVFTILLGSNMVDAPLSTRMLETSWFQSHPALDDDEMAYNFVLYIMGICFAYSLFPREYEERTIEFLHTLPVTRRQLFVSKLSASAAWIVIVLILQEIIAFALQLFNHDSLTAGQFSLQNSFALFFMSLALALTALCHGLLASVGRHFGLYALVFGAWALGYVSERTPELEVLKPINLGLQVFHGKILQIPWTAIGLHLTVGLVCLLLAERLWSRRGHQSTHLITVTLKKWPKMVGCLTALLGFAFFILWAVTSPDEESDEVAAPEGFSTFTIAKTTTEHYEFTFPTGLRETAMGLIQRSDGVYEDVFIHLGMDGPNEKIVADLADVSHEHLGIASRGTLKVDLTDSQDPGMLDHILSHETCHVLAYRLSGHRGYQYGRLLSAFHEGTASYYAYELTESPRRLIDSRRHALATYLRHDLEFEDLFDADELQERIDDTAKYTLGEIWVAALVRSHGPDAPRKVWRAIDRKAPKDLEAVVFWRDTFQAAGIGLEKTRATWESMLGELEEQEADFLEQLPELSVRADREGDNIVVTGKVSKPFPEDWPGLVLRIREKGSIRSWSLRARRGEDGTTIRAIVPEYWGNDFDYQIGIKIADDGYPVLNEWREASNL